MFESGLNIVSISPASTCPVSSAMCFLRPLSHWKVSLEKPIYGWQDLIGSNDLYCFSSEMMSGSESPTLMNPGDEIWTEEEVIEFGLAGEEEYCDLETVETSIDLPTMPEVAETAELVYLDDAELTMPETEPDISAKKSGRVRTITYFMLLFLLLMLFQPLHG